MEEFTSYVNVVATFRVRQELNKPLFGKPYLKLGQCLHMWGYLLQLSGVLGAKHAEHLDVFGRAFLGAKGEAGAVRRAFTAMASDTSLLSMTFTDYVFQKWAIDPGSNVHGRTVNDYIRDEKKRLGIKVKPEDAFGQCQEHALLGAALGALYPQQMGKVFERTFAPVPKERWELARRAGLDIPPSQDLMSFEEAQEEENEQFMAYCKECCPSLYPALTA